MPDLNQIHAEQVAYWNGEGGTRWVARQAHTDSMLAPVTEAALAFAAARPRDHVLDIGCGCGGTTLALAASVPQGRVTGLDVSAPMLAVAEARQREAMNVEWLLADAASHPFEPHSFDLLFSRFGVMFFGDPVAAFANLRRAMRPGARLAFACWCGLADNPWMEVPLRAAEPHLPPLPPPQPGAPGPLAFADPDRVARILTGAGWAQPEIRRHRFSFDLAGGKGLDTAAEHATRMGAAARAMAGQPEAMRLAAAQAIRAALAPHATGDGRVLLDGTVWLVGSENA